MNLTEILFSRLDSKNCEKILSTFLDIFGKFVNKNAVKSGFGVVLVEVSQKSRKMLIFLEKIIFNYGKNLRYFYQGAKSPHPNISQERFKLSIPLHGSIMKNLVFLCLYQGRIWTGVTDLKGDDQNR